MSEAPVQPNPAGTPPDLWGDGEPADQVITRGPWQFTVRSAEIADLGFAGQPILRGIRFIVRDHDWRTAENEVMTLHQDEDGFSIEARSTFDGQAMLEWTATLWWRSTTLRYSVQAHVVRHFRRNRIGLVVLHRPELAGTRLDVMHPDNSTETAVFPQHIAPHQPAQQVAGYRWDQDRVRCTLRLSGDIFEMEDQRNWTDASYKTYSTPLAEPFPVAVEGGEQIHHELELTCTAGDDKGDAVAGEPNLITPRTTTLPVLQVGAATDAGSIDAERTVDCPVLVEVPADEAHWGPALDRATAETVGPLDVRIIVSTSEQLRPVVHRLSDPMLCARVARIGVYRRSTHLADPELLNELAALLERESIETEIVAGTRAHFTELNRNVGLFDDWDGALSFSLTPQMHDRSRAQVIESIRIQRVIAEQAVQMACGRPVHLGPVTLRPRFNAVATSSYRLSDEPTLAFGYGPAGLPDATDPRQHAPALAAGTVAAIAALSVCGVASITLFETWGQRGLRQMPDAPLEPAGLVIKWLRSGGTLIEPPVELVLPPLRSVIACIAQESPSGRQIVIGNLGKDAALVRINAISYGLEFIGAPTVVVNSLGNVDLGDPAKVLRVPAFSCALVRI